jgi:rhodanese-related sulfurtransferase
MALSYLRTQHRPAPRRDSLYGRRPGTIAPTHRAIVVRLRSQRARKFGVAAELIRQGYRAMALKGGIVEWLAASLPTETKDAPKQATPEPAH